MKAPKHRGALGVKMAPKRKGTSSVMKAPMCVGAPSVMSAPKRKGASGVKMAPKQCALSCFVPPTPQFPREKKRRALGRRAWRGRQGSTALASLRLSPIGAPAMLAPSPRLSSARWGAPSHAKHKASVRLPEFCFISAKLDPSERHPKSYFLSAKLDPSMRRPSPPCIAPRDAVERMVVSCERSERGADAGTARKTSIVPRTK
jgi:hypothetical protein